MEVNVARAEKPKEAKRKQYIGKYGAVKTDRKSSLTPLFVFTLMQTTLTKKEKKKKKS